MDVYGKDVGTVLNSAGTKQYMPVPLLKKQISKVASKRIWFSH